tara:strand:- start:6100 stop:6390 length:291 start_codon:yes stop_codon:yes gene_type:complete
MENSNEYEVFKLLHDAKLQGAAEERAKWEGRIKEHIKEDDSDGWVTTKEAKKILKRTSYNCLMSWVKKGLINPPKKIGRPLYWEKANLLKMSPNGK